jgi:hypothetical protein
MRATAATTVAIIKSAVLITSDAIALPPWCHSVFYVIGLHAK